MSEIIILSDHLIKQLFFQAINEYPHECCGILGGRNSFFRSYYPTKNSAQFPKKQYVITPIELFKAMKTMRKLGESNLGIYHSHPSSSAYPSNTDVVLAFYPNAIYIIISVVPLPIICAYKITDQKIKPIEISIFK